MQNPFHVDRTEEFKAMNARLAKMEEEMDQVIAETDAMIEAVEQCETSEEESPED